MGKDKYGLYIDAQSSDGCRPNRMERGGLGEVALGGS